VQFLASLGYAVLQPNYRGSTGFGSKHFLAGWRTWGMAMQDDITDGVEYLVAKGLVDRNRVCIMGASYGGYATLMGLVSSGRLRHCAKPAASRRRSCWFMGRKTGACPSSTLHGCATRCRNTMQPTNGWSCPERGMAS
jgi:dienelactone hydrolase